MGCLPASTHGRSALPVPSAALPSLHTLELRVWGPSPGASHPSSCSAHTPPPGSRAPPSNSEADGHQAASSGRRKQWKGARRASAQEQTEDCALYPNPPTCRLLLSPLRGGILSQTLGELPRETRHLECVCVCPSQYLCTLSHSPPPHYHQGTATTYENF